MNQNTIFYPDVSDAGNRGLILIKGTVAVAAKCSEGTTFQDPSYKRFKKRARRIHAFFFAYHWVWSSDDSEVQNAYKMAKRTPLFLDCENLKVLLSVSIIVDFVIKYRKLGGTCNAVYLPKWYWERMGSPDLTPLRNLGLILISSDYSPYSTSGIGWMSYGGMVPTIWQYTNEFPYGIHHRPTDMNAFKGTLDELKRAIEGKKKRGWYWFPGWWRMWKKYRSNHGK